MKRVYKRWRIAAKIEAIVKFMKCCHSLMQRGTMMHKGHIIPVYVIM